MKIMKVLGAVVGIHVLALILIFANPGCSSTTKPTPAPVDTVARAEPAPAVSVPGVSPSVSVPMAASPVSAAPAFNPDAPALAANGGGVRFSPTRPGTPAEAALIAQPVTDVLPASTYTVKPGDSLWTIGKKNGLAPSALADANNLKPNATLHEGQKLLIPSKPVTPMAASTPATTAASARKAGDITTATKASGDSVKHTVKSGETLSTIAKKYGVKQGDIAVANNITDPQKIYLGMELIIPGWQTPSGKSTPKAGSATATKGGSSTSKGATPEIKPIFNSPASTPSIGPGASSAVPTIKVEEAPTPVTPGIGKP